MTRFICCILLPSLLASCGIQQNPYAHYWTPYKPPYVHVFHSEKGQVDSLFISEVQETRDGVKVISQVINNGPKEELPLLTVKEDTGKDGIFELTFRTKAVHFDTYRQSLAALEAMPKNTFEVYGITYKDVLLFTPPTVSEDSTAIKELYWSKTNGVVKFVQNNGSKWELVKKYSL